MTPPPSDEAVGITWSGDASEGFSDQIAQMKGWYVRITPQQGEPFDAQIVGSALDVEIDGTTWYDAVRYVLVDPDTGLIDNNGPATFADDLADDDPRIQAVRVKSVQIY